MQTYSYKFEDLESVRLDCIEKTTGIVRAKLMYIA